MHDYILPIVIAIFASTGFWSFLQAYISSKRKTRTAEERLLMGLAYSKICELAAVYLERDYITQDEYSDLRKYLFEPYREMGGNGTCEKLMAEVEKLPIRKS